MGTGDVGTVDQTLTGERADLAQTLAKTGVSCGSPPGT